MSVVAGVSLFYGVLVCADARATLSFSDGRRLFVDNVQKIFPIDGHSVVGFVGDIEAAGAILESLFQLTVPHARPFANPVTFTSWLPRFLRHQDRALRQRGHSFDLEFLVGSVLKSRLNQIERKRVVELMERFRLGKLSIERSWLPGVLVSILKTPPETTVVALEGSPRTAMITLKSPDYLPKWFKALEFTAIGSGHLTSLQIERMADWVFAGDVGNLTLEAEALRGAVEYYLDESGEPTVGGLLPSYHVGKDGIHALSYSATIPAGGARYELQYRDDRWIQINHDRDRRIALQPPWEVDYRSFSADDRFDDLRDALRDFRAP